MEITIFYNELVLDPWVDVPVVHSVGVTITVELCMVAYDLLVFAKKRLFSYEILDGGEDKFGLFKTFSLNSEGWIDLNKRLESFDKDELVFPNFLILN